VKNNPPLKNVYRKWDAKIPESICSMRCKHYWFDPISQTRYCKQSIRVKASPGIIAMALDENSYCEYYEAFLKN
jgi:hypothetical protein